MSVRSCLLSGLAAILLAAGPVAAAKPPTPDEAAEAYVQGRLALAEDDLGTAAQRFDLVLKAGADDQLRRRALDVAILGGDMPAAVKLANQIALQSESAPGEGLEDSMVALTRLAGATAARDWKAYDAARIAFAAPGRGGESGKVLATLLEAYGLAARGDVAGGLAIVEADDAKGISGSYMSEHRAHLLALAKRWPEAADAYGAIVAAEGANVTRLRIAAAAAALEAASSNPQYRSKAILILGGGPARDPYLMEARARLAADPKMQGRKLGAMPQRASEGLGLLFLRLAADLGRERATGPALSFARLATFVEPGLQDAWFVTADALVRSDKPDLALQTLDKAPTDAPTQLIANARRASILASEDRTDEARAILQRLTARPDASSEDWARLADVERRAKNYPQSIALYGKALQLLPEPAGPAHAQLLFLRGSVNEVAGNWADAEADLRKAAELQPDNPVILNYLGYSLLDRRMKIDEARDLIARAYKAAPDNGAIIDSMGWAEYVRGNYAEAVQLLERARAAEPADPTVADHLGDALWKAGRRIEARHAWNSAAALSPEPELQALLAKKLDFGLDIALASR